MTNNKPENKSIHTSVEKVKEMAAHLDQKETRYVNSFKYRHKIVFAFIVFFGINLLWYGMWTIISELPVLKNPIIAIIIGAVILIGSGYFYENMISEDLNKKPRKKKVAANLTSKL